MKKQPTCRTILALILAILLLPRVLAAACIEPYQGMVITENTFLCGKSYEVTGGIRVGANNVVLDCQTGILKGFGQDEGITAENVTNITIRHCNVINYNVGIYLRNVTFSFAHDNTLLKNYVGIRLYDAFENRIENNADKSHTKAISAITSKFNNVVLTNKNVEHGFCDVNLCNTPGTMNPCEDNDFYCSPNCSWENDNNCPNPNAPKPAPLIAPEEQSRTEELLAKAEEALANDAEEIAVQEAPAKKEHLSLPWQVVVYALTYLAGFLVVQHHLYAHKKK